MSDEINNELYMALVRNRYNKSTFFRRRRKHKGKDWQPNRIIGENEQISSRGIFCPRCSIIHPYNGSRKEKLGMDYERRNSKVVVFWLCPNSGDVLGELGSKHDSSDN